MFIFKPMRRDSIITIGLGLSLALAATAVAQDGLITTARKTSAPEVKVISKETEDLLAPLPGTGVIIDRTKDALVPVDIKLGGAAPAPDKADPKARRPGMKIFAGEAKEEAESIEAKAAPPPTVGRTKANPLCLVEGVLIACGSTPPAKDKAK